MVIISQKKKKEKYDWLQCTEKCEFVLYCSIGRNKWAYIFFWPWSCGFAIVPTLMFFYVGLNLMYMNHMHIPIPVTGTSLCLLCPFTWSIFRERKSTWCLQLKYIGHSWFDLAPSTSHVAVCFVLAAFNRKNILEIAYTSCPSFFLLQLLPWAAPVTESKAAHLSNQTKSPPLLVGGGKTEGKLEGTKTPFIS